MSFRKGIEFKTSLESDVNSLTPLILPLIEKYDIHAMKDPTRGGLASALNEIASKSNITMTIVQEKVPIEDAVRSASELLGLDPYEITCEGQAIICAPANEAESIVKELKEHPLGKKAVIIGEITEGEGKVFLKTEVGGLRRLQKPVGELIPRVC